jgi:hypothetical protein
LRDADAKPSSHPCRRSRCFARRYRHLDCPLGGVRTRQDKAPDLGPAGPFVVTWQLSSASMIHTHTTVATLGD